MTATKIKKLLDRRAKLEAQLRELDRQIAAAGKSYAAGKGVLFLRPERLRQAVEADLAERIAA